MPYRPLKAVVKPESWACIESSSHLVDLKTAVTGGDQWWMRSIHSLSIPLTVSVQGRRGASASPRARTPWTGHQSVTGLMYRDNNAHTLTFTPTGNVGSPVHILHMSLDYGRKLENLHWHREIMQTLPRKSPGMGSLELPCWEKPNISNHAVFVLGCKSQLTVAGIPGTSCQRIWQMNINRHHVSAIPFLVRDRHSWSLQQL